MPVQPSINPLPINLSQTYQQLMTSFDQCDAAGIAARYAETGQLLPAYSATIAGRAAIQAFWQGCMDMGIRALHRQPIEADQWNETVNEVGAYKLYGRDGKLLDVGKYIAIWKWEDDRWQIYRDIWTSNLPPQSKASHRR